jgi:hypothetical protein
VTRVDDAADAPGDDGFDEEAWRRTLRENRAEKDRFLAEHPQSPVPPAEREAFDGLDYYEPAPDYRVPATVTVHDDPEPVPLEASAGPPVRHLHVATFAFDLPTAADRTLRAYRAADDDGSDGGDGLFVPFADATTGGETYADGRYLELAPEREPTTGEAVVLDFNLAFTPFCAFSDAFACPLPPAENRLDAAVRAGERTPE